MKKLQVQKLYRTENKLRTKFLPAGQTTQMIVGASPEPDGQILRLTQALYRNYGLKRVYYSAYTPVVHDSVLPENGAGLLREHRLYQADWLLRFYGFDIEELIAEGGNLSQELDPKCAWALSHPEFFPVEVNKAPYEALLRVPGIGVKSAYRIISARRYASLKAEDLANMRVVMKRARLFITCGGKFYGTENEEAKRRLLTAADKEKQPQAAEQLSIFSSEEIALTAATGQL